MDGLMDADSLVVVTPMLMCMSVSISMIVEICDMDREDGNVILWAMSAVIYDDYCMWWVSTAMHSVVYYDTEWALYIYMQ